MGFKGWSETLFKVLALCALLTWTTSVSADATSADRARARAMMEQGDAAFDKKNYTAALEAYRAAHAIMNVPTTGLAVAQALAGSGQILEAHDIAVQVTQMPATPGEPRPFTVARADAEKLIRDLLPRLGALNIGVEGATSSTVVLVEVDGASWPSSALGHPRVTSPGTHRVRASAAGYSEDEKATTVGEGQTIAVSLVLRPKEAAAPPAEPAVPPSTLAADSPVPQTAVIPIAGPRSPEPGAPESNAAASFWSGQRVTAAVVAGAGIVSIVTGGALALGAKAKYDGVTGCDARGCDDDSYNQRQSAVTQGNVATVVMGVGVAALAGSVVLWLTAPSGAPVTVSVGPTQLAAKVRF